MGDLTRGDPVIGATGTNRTDPRKRPPCCTTAGAPPEIWPLSTRRAASTWWTAATTWSWWATTRCRVLSLRGCWPRSPRCGNLSGLAQRTHFGGSPARAGGGADGPERRGQKTGRRRQRPRGLRPASPLGDRGGKRPNTATGMGGAGAARSRALRVGRQPRSALEGDGSFFPILWTASVLPCTQCFRPTITLNEACRGSGHASALPSMTAPG